jgi:uncharacterized protein with gpF-like domain
MKYAKINQALYIRAYKIAHSSYERQQYPNFKKALNEQTHLVSDYVHYHGVSNLEAHISVLVSAQPMTAAYKRCYTQVGVEHAQWTYNRIERMVPAVKAYSGEFEVKDAEPVNFFSESWRKLMNLFFDTQGADRVTQVTETTKEKIRELLIEAQEQGLTLSEQATYIEDRLNDPDFNRNRAMVIARTESTTASNYSALLGAESSDYETGKMWLAVLDANTRPDHVDASGQTVASDDLFVVGGYLMAYPGAIGAPANEVCNCRCCIAMVPLLNDNGLPILKP